ncbi:MAG: hypothetical protein V8S74_12410 [Lachnospirales bacterium]
MTKGQRVNILIPQKGERKRLVDMARNNAQITLDKFGAILCESIEELLVL